MSKGEEEEKTEEQVETTQLSKYLGKLCPLDSTLESYYVSGDQELMFGRNLSCNCRFNDRHISSKHCRVYVKENEVFVEDESSNGTFVNGEKIGLGNTKKLVHGDQLSLAAPLTKFETIDVIAFTFKSDPESLKGALQHVPLSKEQPSLEIQEDQQSSSPIKKHKTLLYISPTLVENDKNGNGVGGIDSVESSEFKTSDKASQLPPCKYGKMCYRKNPSHFNEFSHPPRVM